jgi:hypothetical protein
MHPLLFALLACSKDENPGNPSEGDDTGNGGYPSDFSTGKYRLTAFTILPPDEGRDWDDDGEVDNNLPNVLSTFGVFLDGVDFSKDGLNVIAADAIDNDTLVILVDATYDDVDLTLDFLAGLVDSDGHLAVDEKASYVDGEPISRVVGTFVGETAYTAGPNSMVFSIPVTPSGTLAAFPLEEVRMDGDLGAISLDGTIAGIIPVEPFANGVLPVFIPESGYDIDGDGEIGSGETQADLIALATTILDTAADVVTESGDPGISAAIHFAAGAAAF